MSVYEEQDDPTFGPLLDPTGEPIEIQRMLQRLHAFARTLNARGYAVAWGDPQQAGNLFRWRLSYRQVDGSDLLLAVVPDNESSIMLRPQVAEPERWRGRAHNVDQLDGLLVSVLKDKAWRRFLESVHLLAPEGLK